MGHPTNRAERRRQRDRVVANRRSTFLNIRSTLRQADSQFDPSNPIQQDHLVWGRYAKWNTSCNCFLCKPHKWGAGGVFRKRREALKRSARDWRQADA